MLLINFNLGRANRIISRSTFFVFYTKQQKSILAPFSIQNVAPIAMPNYDFYCLFSIKRLSVLFGVCVCEGSFIVFESKQGFRNKTMDGKSDRPQI